MPIEKLDERAIQPYLTSPDNLVITPISTGKFNTSFFIRNESVDWVIRVAPSRDSVFIFYERDMMRQEPGIHARLLKQTSVPVAPIVAYDDSLKQIGNDFIIMERLEGRAISDVSCDNNAVLSQVGEFLAQTHAQEADTYGYIGEHAPMEPQSRWADAFHIMWNRLIDGIVEVGHYDAEESAGFRSLLDHHIGLFDRPVPSSLLHVDVWAENILVDANSRVTGLIDWDRALWGDPEIEYAVLDYCGISEPAFWEGYGKERDLSSDAQIRQVFYLLYELQKYIIIRQGRGKDPARARQYKQQVYDILNRFSLD
jgi:aminoglycoside phosphotransferase (APT) family kinase protein